MKTFFKYNPLFAYLLAITVTIIGYYVYKRMKAAKLLAENKARDIGNDFILPDGTKDTARRRDGTYKLTY